MPRIAAALAVLGTVAFCIGFNTVRYPAVWEMLKHPGTPGAAAQPLGGDERGEKGRRGEGEKGAQSTSGSSSPLLPFSLSPPPASRSPSPNAEPEFCTADGVCHIAAGPQIAKNPESASLKDSPPQGSPSPSRPKDASPELPRDSSLSGLGPDAAPSSASSGAGVSPALSLGGQKLATPREAETPATSRAGQTPAASRAGETPAPQPPAQQPVAQPPTPRPSVIVKRPLVPVDDPSTGRNASPPARTSLPAVAGMATGDVRPGELMVASAGTLTQAGGAGVRRLPPVEAPGAAAAGTPQPPLANGSSPFYPTTGYPSVALDRLKPGRAGNLVPVGE